MKLSVLIPVYNEERTLATLVARVLATPFEKELVLVDDCSRDGTPRVIAELAARHPELRSFRHETNQGKGAALATALRHFTGDVVLIQDADLEYDPRDYPKLLRPLLEGKADVVYGSRFVGSDYHRVHLYWHMVGNRVLTTLSNMMTNLNLTDMETCYKVFRREVLRSFELKSDTFDIEPELTAKVGKGRWRVYEVGISYAGRDYSEGKKIGWRDAVAALWAIVRYHFAS